MKIRAILIDLSGTIHIEKQAIPGSVEALKKLKSMNIPYLFVTNTTKESARDLYSKLKSIGFGSTIEEKQIFSSLSAARRICERESLKPLSFLTESAAVDFEGITFTEKDKERGIKPNSVLFGYSPKQFNFNELNEAFRFLMKKENKDAKLIAINMGRYFQTPDGLSLGIGPFISAIEYSTGRKAQVVGKPSTAFFHEAISQLGIDIKSLKKDEKILMVGDDIRDDVGGAQKAGLVGVLVKTGKYQQGDEEKYDNIKPNVIVSSFPDLISKIEKNDIELKTSKL